MFSLRRQALLVGLVVLLDQLTKSWAIDALDNGRVIHILGSLQFSLGFNSGFAFSQGQSLGPVIGIVAVIAVVFLVRALRRATSLLSVWALCAIAAGASGNLADRIFRGDGWLHGRVVDFIDLQWWPVFNVADSAISIGVVLLITDTLLETRKEKGADINYES